MGGFTPQLAPPHDMDSRTVLHLASTLASTCTGSTCNPVKLGWRVRIHHKGSLQASFTEADVPTDADSSQYGAREYPRMSQICRPRVRSPWRLQARANRARISFGVFLAVAIGLVTVSLLGYDLFFTTSSRHSGVFPFRTTSSLLPCMCARYSAT